MELIYAWIEEFRNISNTDFIFNSGYNIQYDFLKEELNLQIKDVSSPSNLFFGEKILNITAIIGKNGCGKTSLMRFFISNFKKRKNYILIFREAKQSNFVYTIIAEGIELGNKNELSVEFEINFLKSYGEYIYSETKVKSKPSFLYLSG